MTTGALQDRLTAMILDNPEVVTLCSVRPAMLVMASRAVSAVIGEQGEAPTILVSESDAGTSVTASVSVSGEHPATAVCRDLHDSIAAELADARATLPLTIAIKISSIA